MKFGVDSVPVEMEKKDVEAASDDKRRTPLCQLTVYILLLIVATSFLGLGVFGACARILYGKDGQVASEKVLVYYPVPSAGMLPSVSPVSAAFLHQPNLKSSTTG